MPKSIEELIRKNIRELTPYSSAREEYSGSEGVFLDANENPFGLFNRYPDPCQLELKKQLSAIKQIPVDQIFIGNGSDEAIDLAYRIFCEPNLDKALTFTPTYGMFEVSAQINAIDLIKVPLDKAFQIDRKKLKPYLSDVKLKLIFICSPNNPTGNLLRLVDIEFILQNFQGIVFIDEAYIDFCDQPSMLSQLAHYPNLIVSQTMSKAWGLAGVRVGIAYMNKNVSAYFNTIKAPYNVSTINQFKALEALKKISTYKTRRTDILTEKISLINALQKIQLIRKIHLSDANFLLVEVADANYLYKKLIEKQIIIRNRDKQIPNCVRITVGTKEENKKLITELIRIDNGQKSIIY